MTKQSTNKRAVLAALLALVLALVLALSAGAALAATIVCDGGRCEGTGQDDQITGSEVRDIIIAKAGNDNPVAPGVGNDEVCLGSGDDFVPEFSGAGDDVIQGGRGGDIIGAGAGKDEVHGGRGGDSLFTIGDGEADTLDCGPGFDQYQADPFDEVTNCEAIAG